MKDFRDYYESLGVAQNATADELKTAYRRAARRYHPDLNPGDETAEEKFKEIGEAYEILSDGDRRSEYDQLTQFLENQKNPTKGLFNLAQKDTKDYSQFKDFSMFVDYLLNRRGESNTATPSSGQKAEGGRQKTKGRRQKAEDKRQKAEGRRQKAEGAAKQGSRGAEEQASKGAEAAEAAGGRRPQNASTEGSRPNPKSKIQNPKSGSPPPSPSPRKENKGDRRSQNPKSKIQNPLTEAQLTLPLNKAYKGGKERIRLADGRSLTVTLPPGMLSGQTVQVTDEASGDRVSLLIQVAPHDLFILDMPDVHCTIPITPSEAILGGPISIPTLDGSVKMVVPAGARSGQKLRLPEKGYLFNGQRGDQIVELEIQMPTTVTARERKLYEKIRLTESFRPRKNLYF